MSAVRTTGNYIGGGWTDPGVTYPTTDPARPGETVARYAASGPGEVADMITREMGKPRAESLAEVVRSAAELRFTAGEGLRSGGAVLPSTRPGVRVHTRREPIGIVAAITPWNFPVIAPIRKIGPALVHGCPVVLKPAEETPGAAVILLEVLDAAGLPPGVAGLVTGSGSTCGAALASDPRVAGISIAGSTEVGRSCPATGSTP